LQHFFGVTFGFDFREDAGNLALGVDEESGALDAHHLFPVHVLFFYHAIGVTHFLVGVGKQGVGQVVFLAEFFLFLRSVGGDAEDNCAGLLNLLECVAEPARFYGSTGSIGFGEKEQHHQLSVKIL
jgi:hypothetical protein